jgi:hypothetical protein
LSHTVVATLLVALVALQVTAALCRPAIKKDVSAVARGLLDA